MLLGYTEDSYVRPPNRLRKKRIDPWEGGRGREFYPSRHNDYYDYGYDDYDDYEPPPRRPPRSRVRPRPRPKSSPRPPARRRAPAAAYYYPEDDDYYEPPRRLRPRYEDEPPRPRSESRGRRASSKPSSRSSSGGHGGAAVIGVVILILLLLLLYMFWPQISNFIENPPPLRYQEFPEGIEFTVRKNMELQASGTRPRDSVSYTLKSASPKDNKLGQDFYLQDVKSVEPQPNPTDRYIDNSGREQEIMIWEEENFLGSASYEITYSITTRFYQWEFEEEDSGNIADIPNGLKQMYNHDEWPIDEDRDGHLDPEDDIDGDNKWDYRIEPTNSRIRSKANDLANGDTNVYKVIKSFYDYLVGNLNYIPSSDGLPKDCTETLSTKRGDCDDYSILFVSLCRAVDIPAWLELGVLYDRQQQRWGGHGWAKVAIPFEGGWTSATVDIVNKQFLYHDPFRFIEWVDTGGDITVTEFDETKTVNNLDYYYHSFSYKSYGSPRITSPNTNDYNTVSMNEFGETKKVPVEGEGGSELCMLPGFDAWELIIAMMAITLVVIISKPTRFKK